MSNNYILRGENAIYYECGFSSDNAIFLSLNKDRYFITDSRYTLEASKAIKDALIIDGGRDLVKKAREFVRKSKIKKLTIDPFEWNIRDFEELKKLKVSFLQKPNLSQKKRIIKSFNEIDILKEAVKKGKLAFRRFEEFFIDEGIGKSEKFLNYSMQNFMRDFGEYELSFEPITAINENSALPHALPTDKKLESNSLLLVDAGLKYKRYCSDRTETFINPKDSFQKKIYDIVLKAHDKAIEAIKEGVKASDIDKVAREVIQRAGYGKYFVHSTGHGVGLDIHELPVISKSSDTILEEGMVFTVEPGIYLENQFGVRIEDMVYIKNGKVEVM